MSYKYLNNSTENATSTEDSNEKLVYSLDVSSAGSSASVGVFGLKVVQYTIAPNSVAGTGTLTLKYSDDGLTWKTHKRTDGTDIEYTLDGSFANSTIVITDQAMYLGHHKWEWDGSNSAGEINIKVVK